jgi:hypothetical protein
MRDDTDSTVIQRAVAEMAAEMVVDKHKTEPAGTTYPIGLESVTVTAPPTLDVDSGVAVPGEPFTTLVVHPRDPLTIDERAGRARAALDPDNAILVAVVEENDGRPLSPTETHRRAVARGGARLTRPPWIQLLGGCSTWPPLAASRSTPMLRSVGVPTRPHSR